MSSTLDFNWVSLRLPVAGWFLLTVIGFVPLFWFVSCGHGPTDGMQCSRSDTLQRLIKDPIFIFHVAMFLT